MDGIDLRTRAVLFFQNRYSTWGRYRQNPHFVIPTFPSTVGRSNEETSSGSLAELAGGNYAPVKLPCRKCNCPAGDVHVARLSGGRRWTSLVSLVLVSARTSRSGCWTVPAVVGQDLPDSACPLSILHEADAPMRSIANRMRTWNRQTDPAPTS